ncbi:MAG: universal stress protein [Proteobacteria bacterium]|nr:universal stress protein [Pseudomonadota bacterium]MBU1386732.1 universal stress protein [Pseudomonadota bacterium]MBU1544380.1 universal stress protein [Pseudomonadota bacterium]MBU2479927.1 universal stress protein [Pseudomonadota bacterium]
MNYTLLHIFRNTPFGRETFLQSLYFCKTIHAYPVVYIPKTDKFLMYFPNDAVQIDLDNSYLFSPKTAKKHVLELFDYMQIAPQFYMPKNFTASSLPDIPANFDYLCCPRSVSDLSSKIGLGHIGPKVRRIIKHATFPVLIASPVFKPWKSISVFFGGSVNAMNALRLGLKLALSSGLPLDVFTLLEKKDESYYENFIENQDFPETIKQLIRQWHFYKKSQFDKMLYEVPHDSLIVLGAYGHGIIKEFLLGSKMEKIQSTVMNNLLITGPYCSISL